MTLSNEWRRMQHYRNMGLKFDKVLDIGAFEGVWTQNFKNIYPDADVLMIEANEEKEEILKKIGSYKIALLGKENNKEVDYYKCLDDTFIFVVDDWNWEHVRKATMESIEFLKLNVLYEKHLITSETPNMTLNSIGGQQHWWNGMYVVVLQKNTAIK